MEISFDFITLVHLLAVAVGIVSAAIIFYFGIKSNSANLPLGIAQLSISLAIWVSFSLISQLLVYWPHFYRTGQIFVFTFISMAFLHVDFYTRERSWKWYDLLHALPVLIYTVDYWDIFWITNAEKKELILQEIDNLVLMGQFNQSKYIGSGFHMEFRTIILSVYWVAQVVLLHKWLKTQSALSLQNKVWKNWMLLFLLCQIFLWLPHYLSIFWLDALTTYHLANSFAVIWLLISSLSLFFFPSLLYGRSLEGYQKASKSGKKPRTTHEEEKKNDILMQQIDRHIETIKPFLTAGYSIHDFSKEIHIPAYQISKVINATSGLGFVAYMNLKRIKYCIAQFEQGEWIHLTLEAVAAECGFNNRNSFTRAFKKVTGISPSDFRLGSKNQQEAKMLS